MSTSSNNLTNCLLRVMDTLNQLIEYKNIEVEFVSYQSSAEYKEADLLEHLTKFFCQLFVKSSYGIRVVIGIEQVDNLKNRIEISVSEKLDVIFHSQLKNKLEPSLRFEQGRTLIELQIAESKLNRLRDYKPNDNKHLILPWYAEIKKQLTTYFKSPKSLELLADSKGSKHAKTLKRMNQLIQLGLLDEEFGPKSLAVELHMSLPKLYRISKSLTKMSPAQYIRFVRLSKAKNLLETGDFSVSQVVEEVGLASNSHFTRIFKKQFGFNPSKIRNNLNNSG